MSANLQFDPRNRQLDDSSPVERIAAALLTLTPDERSEVLRRFCRGCGDFNPPDEMPCQCWNDE